MTGLGLLFAALATIPVALEVMAFHPVVPAGGLVSGMCLALGILGEYPKRYRITDDRTGEQEKATLWKNLSLPLRLGAFALVLVAPALAYGLMFLL